MAHEYDLEATSPIVENQAHEQTNEESSRTSISEFVGEVVGDIIIDGAFDLAGNEVQGPEGAAKPLLKEIMDVGETVLDGAGQVGGAVAEHAGDVAEVTVEAVGTVIGGLLDV